ncbi:hypothetical protein EV121DRAFT_284632 [Schizophyllum commune]
MSSPTSYNISDISAALERATAIVSLELHRNGFRPSVEEVKEIRAQGSILEAHLERIGVDIALLTALRSKVASQVDLHRALASPIRRLVPEVLSEIISMTVWSQPKTRNPLPMAITIASVSSFWRRLARDDPRLWTRAVFVSERQLHLFLDNILPLSRELPLDLEYDGYEDELLFILPDTFPVISAPMIALSLEELYVAVRPHTLDKRSLFDYMEMPHLRDLSLSTVQQLTRLSLNFLSEFFPEDIVPLLRRLAINSSHTHLYDADPGLVDVAHMPWLSDIDCAAGVAPRVDTLSLMTPLQFLCNALLSFLRRSSTPSHITSLEMYEYPRALDPAWIPKPIQCFELLDALEELYVTITPFPAELVRSLVLRDGIQPLLPTLRWMDLGGDEMTTEVRDAIEEVRASRSRRRIVCGRKVVALEDKEAPDGEGDHEWSDGEEE